MRRIGLAVMLIVSLLAPLVLQAEQARKVWRIGLIAVAPRKDQNAVFQGLRELGYVEGENLAVERRYSEGRAERFPEFAAELVRLNVDVILVETTPAALAVKRATRTIPVVFPTAIDPVGAGVVASLARPGGNITGLTTQAPDLIAKRLQLLREVVPHLSQVAVLWNAANPANVRSWSEAQDAARALQLTLRSEEVRGPADFDRVFAAMARAHPAALLLIGDGLTLQHARQIVDFAARNQIPTMLDQPELVAAGALIGYGPSTADLWRRAANYVVKIFGGTRPADLPIEQPTKFELAINLKTAKILGLTIPQSLLLRADEVFQ